MIGSIRRALVRYFRRPATSVSPEFDLGPRITSDRVYYSVPTPAALDRVEEAAQRIYGADLPRPMWFGDKMVVHENGESRVVDLNIVPPFPWIDPHQRGADPEPIGSTAVRIETIDEAIEQRMEEGRRDTGIKPPDVWTWEAWSKEFEALLIDGWSPCQFAHITNKPGEGLRAVFVYGVVRGAFGLWQHPFDVCVHDEQGNHSSTTDVLTIATHLRSGWGIATFGTKADAAQACVLAERCFPWPSVEAYGGHGWNTAAARTRDAWHDFGLRASVNAHAHDQATGYGPIPIMGLSIESASEGKPEKLS